MLSGVVLFCSTAAFAANPAKETSVVQENKEKLIKTKSCPGCNLVGANLNRTDLAGADLQGADLSNAKFFLANLAGANLQKARLRGAGFGGADLAKANLRGADLQDVSFDGAYIEGAHFDKEYKALLKKQKAAAAEELKTQLEETAKLPDDSEKTSATEQEPEATTGQVEKDKVAAPAPAPATAPASSSPTAPAQTPAVQQPQASKTPARNADQAAMATGTTDSTGIQQGAEEEKPVGLPEPAMMSGEAPPVKTVQPMREIVIAEPGAAVTTPSTAKDAGAEQKAETKSADDASQVDSANGQAVATTDQPPSMANDPGGSKSPATEPPADKEKMDNIARLVKSKKCFSCDLSGSNLSGMRLAGADLEKADLSDCNLEEATLAGANLKGAILRRANLKKANLKNADLYKADLTAADLTGADMKKALVDETVLTDAVGVSEDVLKNRN